MTKLFTASPNAYQRRSTPCATYQYYFGRKAVWWWLASTSTSVSDENTAMLWCPSAEAWKAWRNILVSASSWVLWRSTASVAVILPSGVKFGKSVSVSDVQYTDSNLPSISLVGWPFMDKKVQQTLFIATSGHKFFPLPWAQLLVVMLIASWLLLPLLSRMFFYWDFRILITYEVDLCCLSSLQQDSVEHHLCQVRKSVWNLSEDL